MIKRKLTKYGLAIEGFHYVSTEMWEHFQVGDGVFVAEHPEPGVLRAYDESKQFVCCVYQVEGFEAHVGIFTQRLKESTGMTTKARKDIEIFRASRDERVRFLSEAERQDMTEKLK